MTFVALWAGALTYTWHKKTLNFRETEAPDPQCSLPGTILLCKTNSQSKTKQSQQGLSYEIIFSLEASEQKE